LPGKDGEEGVGVKEEKEEGGRREEGRGGTWHGKRKKLVKHLSHTCNPNYSGGRDQEDCSLRPALANSSQDFISKTTHHKKGLVEWLKV
jgi:hypothetical protein